MELGGLEIYLIAVNVVGFILFAVNTWLYRHTEKGRVDGALNVAAFLGGTLGIFVSVLVFDRKSLVVGHSQSNPERDTSGTALSRVFVVCLLVIQICLYVLVKALDLNVDFWSFFVDRPVLVVFLVAINLAAFIVFGIDKYRSMPEHRGQRVREMVLLALSFFGGSIGALAAMYLFRHKINTPYFEIGVPLMLLMQVVVIFCAMNVTTVA